jgi:N-acetylglucosamine-6-sulfatase
MSRGRNRRWTIILLAVTAITQSSAVSSTQAQTEGPVATPMPNVVVIVTDDQRADTLWAMPTVRSELVGRGIRFANGFASNPLCCPSRASILTGTYSHTNRVYTNKASSRYGGFAAFDDASTLATWLDEEGYRTALFGKYLNGYGSNAYVPPGWDRWFATFDNGGFYDYSAVSDGTFREFGSDPADYGTTVLAEETVSFIEKTRASDPLFVYFAPHAPHEPASAAPGDGRTFRRLPDWRPHSFNERDVSDKPAYIRESPRLTAAERGEIDAFRRDQYRSLLAVDRAIGDILHALEDANRLENTLLFFMSDNGMSWGEHRWGKKLVPYEESIRVPFVVRYDATIQTPRVDHHLVVNIDVAPTIMQIVGAEIRGLDGRSLVPLFTSRTARWRTDFLLEHMHKERGRGVPTYCGVRSEDYVYVRYYTGEREFYDLERDPDQLVNRIGRDRYDEVVGALHRRLRELCRPMPPGYSF